MPDKTTNNSALTEKQAETKSEFEKVGQFKYVINSALGSLSAFFWAVCSAYLSAVVTLPLVMLIPLGMMLTLSGTEWFGLDSPITFLIVGFASSLLL